MNFSVAGVGVGLTRIVPILDRTFSIDVEHIAFDIYSSDDCRKLSCALLTFIGSYFEGVVCGSAEVSVFGGVFYTTLVGEDVSHSVLH